MKLTRRVVVLAKTEAVYGQDAVPTGANAILCNSGVGVQPQGDVLKRDAVRDTLSPLGSVVGAKTIDFDVSVEFRGGGLVAMAVQAPEYDPLLLACGMRREAITELTLTAPIVDLAVGDTVTDDTSGAHGTVAYVRGKVVGLVGVAGGVFAVNNKVNDNDGTIAASPASVIGYAPVSDPLAVQSCTVMFFKDGILHKALGCLGTWELSAPSGKYGTLKFTLKGLWVDPVDAAPTEPQYLDLVPPVCAGMGLTVGGATPAPISTLSLKLGAEVVKRVDLNAPEGFAGLAIKSREPTGGFDPETTDLATFNPWAAWKNADTAAIHARIGSEAGNTVDVYVPKAQYSEVKYGDRENLVTYDLAFTCNGDAGDDELRLLYR